MSLHFPMPKIRTISVSSHFPLPKNRTFRFSLHTSCLTIVALKFAMSSHFPLPKNSPSLFRLSLEWREPRDEWSKTQDKKWSNSAQSYIVREVHSVRERDTERERERERERRKWRHHCRAKIGAEFYTFPCQKCAPNIGEEFCAFPCQKICTSVSPLLNSAEVTLSVAKNVAPFETVRILRTVKWRDWQGIEAAKQTIKFPAAPFFFLAEKIEKMNQINTKNYWK